MDSEYLEKNIYIYIRKEYNSGPSLHRRRLSFIDMEMNRCLITFCQPGTFLCTTGNFFRLMFYRTYTVLSKVLSLITEWSRLAKNERLIPWPLSGLVPWPSIKKKRHSHHWTWNNFIFTHWNTVVGKRTVLRNQHLTHPHSFVLSDHFHLPALEEKWYKPSKPFLLTKVIKVSPNVLQSATRHKSLLTQVSCYWKDEFRASLNSYVSSHLSLGQCRILK